MLPGEWFDYPDLELGGVLMTTIQEMLLQSHDGIIRVFPAMPAEWTDAGFRLRAVGGFLITAELRRSEVQPFLIESTAGGECRTEAPWTEATVKSLASGKVVGTARNKVLRFGTERGERYLVFHTGASDTLPRLPDTPSARNGGVKEWHGRRIGIPRQF